VRSGDKETRHEPELVTEEIDPVLSRGDGLRVLASDGESIRDMKAGLLIGTDDRAGRGSDGKKRSDRVEDPEKASRSKAAINGD
jgi:hypothetical protein